MKNKIAMVTAFLAVMLVAGAASATSTSTTLGNTNTPQLNGIQVTVTYDNVSKNVSVQYVAGSAPVTNTVLGIDQVYYNLSNKVSPCPTGWTCNFGGNTADSFGHFLSYKNDDPGGTGGISSAIVFPLSGTFAVNAVPPPVATNDNGSTTAVHVRFSGGCSGWVSDGTPGVTSPNTNCIAKTSIPEFPNVALPIAGVIGLVFFFQHRKKKNN